jgi:hypothetical protein
MKSAVSEIESRIELTWLRWYAYPVLQFFSVLGLWKRTRFKSYGIAADTVGIILCSIGISIELALVECVWTHIRYFDPAHQN